MVKKAKNSNGKGAVGKSSKSSAGKSSNVVKGRSATTGRFVTKGHAKRSPSKTVTEGRREATRDAGEFADRFMERYPNTFHELSKR